MAYDPADWDTADDTAKDTAQHFYADSSGAHVTDGTGAELLLTSNGIDINDDNNHTTAFFHADGAQVGYTGAPHLEIGSEYIGIFTAYIDLQQVYHVENVLNLSYNHNNDYSQVIAPSAGLWLQGNDGNVTVASKSGDASAAVRLRGGRMQVIDQTGTQLWTGTAQEMADALNFKASAPRIYNGVKTVNVGNTSQTSAMIWTAAQFESAFNVSSGHAGDCGVMLCNGNVQAGQLGAVSAEWWNSSYNPYGWRARWTIGATGNKAFSYVVTVPASYSTV